MILRNSLFFLALLTTFSLQAQTYLDALVLDSVIVDSTFDLTTIENNRKVVERLRPYLNKQGPQSKNPNFIIQQFKNPQSPNYNPILADLFPPSSGMANIDDLEGMAGGGPDRQGGGGLGGLTVTNIADGLARFLVQRTKQEINQAFFRHFYQALQDPHFMELRTLYPQTYQMFSTIDQDIYRFSYFTESMQESFRKDLQMIPMSMNNLIQSEKYAPMFAQPFHQSLASLALVSSQELVNGADPRQMIHNIAYSDAWTVDSAIFNLRSSFQVLDLIAGGMQDGQKWLKRDNLNQLISSENRYALKIFLGLLYAKADTNIRFLKADNSTLPLRTLLVQIDNAEDSMQIFRRYISNFGDIAVNMQAQVDNFKQRKDDNNEQPVTDGYYTFAAAFVGALQQGVTFKNSLGLVGGYDSTFLAVMGHVNNMSLDIKLKNYSSAVVNLVQVLQSSVAPSSFGQKTELLRYSSFIASVAQASSSQEIAWAIEAVAMPVGSASIKKYSQWNLSINAYVGGFYGIERLEGLPLYNGEVYGVAAPVGIAVSHGIAPRRDAGSITLFASLIDIGAVTAFRFQDPFTEELPEIQLQNIFAPGGYLIYGFPKWPLSLGIGYQQGPQLREVMIDQNILIEANGSRLSAFLAVDIPIFNLYTSSY